MNLPKILGLTGVFSSLVLAGGLNTNTNQSVLFQRSVARDASTDVDAPYANPSGTAFMEDGLYISLNNQTFWQSRSTTVEKSPIFEEGEEFKGKAFDLSGKIEAEDFDIPGKGKGNNSYSVSGDCNDTWNTEYRKGTSVKIGEKNGGLVLGCNPTGNYFQYTINAAEAGTFKLKAAVAADGNGAVVFKRQGRVGYAEIQGQFLDFL